MKYIWIIVIFGLIIISCAKAAEPVVTPNPASDSTPQATAAVDYNIPRTFSNEELKAQDPSAGIWSEGKSVWDIPKYKQIESYYELTPEETILIGNWEPILSHNLERNTESFSFWPNKIFGIWFRTGYMKGIWEIKNNILKITPYIVSFPSGTGAGYITQSLKPQVYDLINIQNLSSKGFTILPFAVVLAPEIISKKYPRVLNIESAYYYKALAQLDVTGGDGLPFIDYMQRIIKAGNPSPEDIFAEKIPNARDFW